MRRGMNGRGENLGSVSVPPAHCRSSENPIHRPVTSRSNQIARTFVANVTEETNGLHLTPSTSRLGGVPNSNCSTASDERCQKNTWELGRLASLENTCAEHTRTSDPSHASIPRTASHETPPTTALRTSAQPIYRNRYSTAFGCCCPWPRPAWRALTTKKLCQCPRYRPERVTGMYPCNRAQTTHDEPMKSCIKITPSLMVRYIARSARLRRDNTRIPLIMIESPMGEVERTAETDGASFAMLH